MSCGGGYKRPSLAFGEEWITFSDPGYLAGGATNKQSRLASQGTGLFSVRSSKQALNAAIKKAPHFVRDFFVCAQDWIRTSTPFPALPPQGSASTNFATWARGRTNLCKNQDMKKWSGYF